MVRSSDNRRMKVGQQKKESMCTSCGENEEKVEMQAVATSFRVSERCNE